MISCCSKLKEAQCGRGGSCECDQVFWVRLDVIEDYKHGRIGLIICDAVVQVCGVPRVLGGRGDQAASSLGEVSDQDPGKVHPLLAAGVGFGVASCRVDRVHRKVRAVADHRTYRTKHSLLLIILELNTSTEETRD